MTACLVEIKVKTTEIIASWGDVLSVLGIFIDGKLGGDTSFSRYELTREKHQLSCCVSSPQN